MLKIEVNLGVVKDQSREETLSSSHLVHGVVFMTR